MDRQKELAVLDEATEGIGCDTSEELFQADYDGIMNRAYRFPYLNPEVPIEERLEDLLSRMTMEEKIAQTGMSNLDDWVQDYRLDPKKVEENTHKLAIGSVHQLHFYTPEGKPWFDDPKRTIAALVQCVNELQKYLVEETRLGIPAIVTGEAVHGHMAGEATVYPHAIAMSSSWDPELLTRVADTVAGECRAAGISQILSPVFDLAREPRWGRVQETYGEDPYLAERMGVAYIKGLQGGGPPIDQEHCAATAKHFVGHGSPQSGVNIAPVAVGARETRTLFLPAFEAAVKEAKALCVMTAYHETDGVPLTASYEYLTQVLKHEWGFQGYVYSDWMAVRYLHEVHRVASSVALAGKMAIEAGVDMDAPMESYGRLLLKLVEEGKVAENVVEEAARRVLRVKFLLGLFENPYTQVGIAARVRNSPEHRALARQVAQESLILLKNDGALLPFAEGVKSIAVIGPNADQAQLGSYSGRNGCLVSPLQGIGARAGEQVTINYARGCGLSDSDRSGFDEAVAAARKSDVAVVVVGEGESICGEGIDTHDLELPGVQLDLVKAVHATGTPVVVVLVNGRQLAVEWIAQNVPVIIETWFPGEEGGNALADVLFGDVNPSGKLTVSMPRSTGHIPVFYNHKPSFAATDHACTNRRGYIFSPPTPVFEFGHGLSYTTFEYSDLKLSPKKIGRGGKVKVSVTVTNTGGRAGAEVVQLYINDVYSSVETPVKLLRAFRKVWLDPQESRVVEFTLDPRDMQLLDVNMKWVVEPGDFEVMVGGLKCVFEVAE